MFEHVYIVWDYFDGPRSGIADFNGSPHYFHGVFDEESDDYLVVTKKGCYLEIYDVTPIDDEILSLALKIEAIFRDWELKFHSGLVDETTHPGYGGKNHRYDELRTLFEQKIGALPNPKQRLGASFRQKEIQPDIPDGCLKEMEVEWDL